MTKANLNLAVPATTDRTHEGQRKRTAARLPLAEAQADVALVDISDICALLRASKSWVHAEVAAGRFPSPAIKRPRFTRWRLSDIRRYLIESSETSVVDAGSRGSNAKQRGGGNETSLPMHDAAEAPSFRLMAQQTDSHTSIVRG
jgi:predicted DNA-binding transcriptional regulator AlpA